MPRQVFSRIRNLKRKLQRTLDEVKAESVNRATSLVHTRSSQAITEQEADELPVVARLMVEIRSDGKRTVARGAMEENATGERVAIRADGASPMELAGSLAKSLFTLPILAAQAVRATRRNQELERSTEQSSSEPLETDGRDLQEPKKP